VLLVSALACAGVSICGWLPYWPVNPLLTTNPWVTFQLDLARCLWAVLPAACLWGASFPLALAAAGARHRDTGRGVGAVYAANTVGAIVGALAFSMILIPTLGTQWAQRILIGVAAVAAVLMLALRLRGSLAAGGRLLHVIGRLGTMVAVPIAAAALAFAVPAVPGELFAFGRKVLVPEFEPKMLYVGEGMNASVAVSEREAGIGHVH